MKRFEDGSRVCFVGDSITHAGGFIRHIVACYRSKFPSSGVEFYNCGIAGGTLGNTLKVFCEDIAIYDPTHIVLMIGINDSGRGRLAEKTSAERYNALRDAYESYKKNLEAFYAVTKERGIELLLCTPMPYAEYIESDCDPLRGGYALIQGYADAVRRFAAEKEIELCDYHALATERMQSEGLFNPDRVHPNAQGHKAMAKAILDLQGIGFEPSDRYSDDIEEWYGVTQSLRNIITTEYFTVPNYTALSDDERSGYIASLNSGLADGSYKTTDYFASLIRQYGAHKPRQAEYIEYVKSFMKNKA